MTAKDIRPPGRCAGAGRRTAQADRPRGQARRLPAPPEGRHARFRGHRHVAARFRGPTRADGARAGRDGARAAGGGGPPAQRGTRATRHAAHGPSWRR